MYSVYMSAGTWDGEVCRRCGHRNTVGFTVPDELWARVVGDPNTIRCLTCFDEEAQEKGVPYTGADITTFYPVSWSDWIEDPTKGTPGNGELV